MLNYTKEGLTAVSGDCSGLRPGAYYNYELAGVVVHTGTADSGHYYAYIKDMHPSQSGRFSSVSSSSDGSPLPEGGGESKGSGHGRAYRWLEFNDSEVTEFSESRYYGICV